MTLDEVGDIVGQDKGVDFTVRAVFQWKKPLNIGSWSVLVSIFLPHPLFKIEA